MKIPFLLLLGVLTLSGVDLEVNNQVTLPENDLISANDGISISGNYEKNSGFLSEPKVIYHVKNGFETSQDVLPVSGRGITINTVME
jgi:hypothetical protein